MAAVKTGTDPKRRADFLDTMEEEMRRVSEHLERRERRLGLKYRRSNAGEVMNGYSISSSFSEGSGAEAGARRRRINHYPRTWKKNDEEEGSSSDTRSPSPAPRSAPPDRSPPRFSEQLPPTGHSDGVSSAERASPAASRSTHVVWSSRRRPGSCGEDVKTAEEQIKHVTTGNRDRRSTSSSPLRSPPPPVAPKPRSRGSPGPHRDRAGSAPPATRPSLVISSIRERKAEGKVGEPAAVMEECAELLETGPTPVPIEISDAPNSPSLTPEPSEPLLVVHQTVREHSGTPESGCSTLSPCPSTPVAVLEVSETHGKEAASPGIIEISGHFSFAKKRTIERRGEEGEAREGGLERVEEEEEEEEGREGEEVASALLEAMMEEEEEEEECVEQGAGLQQSSDLSTEETAVETAPQGSNDDITPQNSTPQEPEKEQSPDPQGLEVKTLQFMSPARGRKVSPVQQRRNQELDLAVRELQLQLREKEEDVGRQRRAAEREARERGEQVERLEREAQKWEKEKWELLKRARDGAERALSLQTQLGVKETQLRSLQADVGRTRDEMMSVKSANTSLRALLSELRAPKPTKDVGVQASLGPGTLRRNTSMELAVEDFSRPSSRDLERGVDFRASTTNLDRGANHRISNCSAMSEGWSMTQGAWDRSSERWDREQSVTSVASSRYDPGSMEGTPSQSPHSGRRGKKKRGPLFGKLKRSTGKRGSTPTILDGVDLSQSSLVQGTSKAPISFPYHTKLAVETQEHWRLLEEAERVPFNMWNGSTIVAWVATGLGMPHCVSAVREHITTGNALLALSDSDMDKKLSLSNPLHRRKLRLAIEERRRPDRVRYPLAGRIDCGWLAEVWISHIGLPQYSDLITQHLIDGRVLESLTKDDLKKYFKLKKIEVLSFLSGVELLRMHDYNRQIIEDMRASQQRRSSLQNPLYWTNRDVGDWIRDIQLGDYATNLLQSGVHGAMLFLEKDKFSSDQLAHILQLPSGKHVARKHLAQQMTRSFRDEGTEHLYMSQQNSVMSFQSIPGGNSPLSPPFSGSLYRAGSSPSLNTANSPTDRLSMEDRIRHSLRESALRSVMMSPRTPSPSSPPTSQFSHPPSPHLPSAPSPLTQSKASSTIV